ncbi:hypothetical protein JCM19992_33820 [Thermostilla marina]
MLRIKTSVDLESTKLPLREAIDLAAKSGAEAVVFPLTPPLRPEEFGRTAVREVRKILEDRRLQVSAVRFPTRYGYDSPIRIEERIAGTKLAMEIAYQLGAGKVINRLGNIPPEDDPARAILTEVLHDLARHAERAGAALLGETGQESGVDWKPILDELPEGAIGLDLNTAHLAVHGHDPAETVREVGHRIFHVHLTDASGTRGLGAKRQVPLGQGDLDPAEVLGLLEEHDYRGYFAVQTVTSQVEGELREAVAYLKRF